MAERKLKGIRLSEMEDKRVREVIKDFFLNERDEDISILMEQQMMDLFTEELAPVIYNRALSDARKWYEKKQEDLESDYYSLYME